jgi:NhaP-type Na+/H+ or K+/H+ antiporter
METLELLASDGYVLLLLGLGLAFLMAAVLPHFLSRSMLSLPIVLVACGLALGWLMPDTLKADPIEHGVLAERLAELAVIISLMSAGLKIDRPLGWRRWATTRRLLVVTMPLCIAALALGGIFLLGLPLAAALLLGAVLAPTDPVLASSVQVAPPGEGDENETRFALTSEAGLNDGLAFPFVNLAIVVAATGLAWEGLSEWLLIDVLWKIAAGIVVGILVGQCVAWLVFRVGLRKTVIDGAVALALTLVAYGATELVHGYGFIGVFVAALVFRRMERDHEHHKELHDFSEQIETLLMSVILILLGAAIANGLFAPLTWQAAGLGLFFVLAIRPLAGLLGLIGTGIAGPQKRAIAVYGIRGIGTFYYLAYGLNNADISDSDGRLVWAISGFIVVVSIVLHGATAPWVMDRLGTGSK